MRTYLFLQSCHSQRIIVKFLTGEGTGPKKETRDKNFSEGVGWLKIPVNINAGIFEPTSQKKIFFFKQQ